MRGRLLRVGAGVVVVTSILLTLIVLIPSRRALLVEIYELVVAGIAIVALLGAFRTFEPEVWRRSPFERKPEQPEESEPIAELERIDRTVVLGAANEFDLHYRLRPLLRKVAAERLYRRHGVELDGEPERAKPLLGDDLWELVRPDRKLGRRSASGLPASLLAAHVARLEQL